MPAFDLRGKYRFAYFLAETRQSRGWCWGSLYPRHNLQSERIYRDFYFSYLPFPLPYYFNIQEPRIKISNNNSIRVVKICTATHVKFRITIFHVFDSLSSIQNCIVVIIVDKKDREKESISSSTTYVCYSFFLQVGRSYRPPEKKKRRRRRAEKLERFPSMDRWLISSILLPPVLFAAPIVAFEHVRLLTESVGPPCQRACTGSSIISAESVSSFLKQKRGYDDENEVPSMDEVVISKAKNISIPGSKFRSEFLDLVKGYLGRRCLNSLSSNSFHDKRSASNANISNLWYNKKVIEESLSILQEKFE